MLYKFISALHVILSLISLVVFTISLLNVKRPAVHQKYSKLFIYFGLSATVLSVALVAIALYAKNYFPYFESGAAIPDRHTRFMNLNYFQFSYLNAFTRGLIFTFLCFRIMKLRQMFKNLKFYYSLQSILVISILSLFIKLTQNYNYLFYRGLLFLLISYFAVEALAYKFNSDNAKKHSVIGLFTFLMFLQTGLTGGVSNFISELSTNQPLPYYTIRFYPLILTLLYWLYLVRKTYVAKHTN